MSNPNTKKNPCQNGMRCYPELLRVALHRRMAEDILDVLLDALEEGGVTEHHEGSVHGLISQLWGQMSGKGRSNE